MSADVGRGWTFQISAEDFVAGARTKNFTINNTPVDISSDDDSGYRSLLEKSGQKQIDASIEGVIKADDIVEKTIDGTLISTCTLTLTSGATIDGDFRLNDLELGLPYNDAITFTANLQSTGEFTYTAAA